MVLFVLMFAGELRKRESNIQVEKAKKVLSESSFPALALEIKAYNPDEVVEFVTWDENGYYPSSEGVSGMPNTAGIVFKWDMARALFNENGQYLERVSFKTIIIRAEANGDITVFGGNNIKITRNWREMKPHSQQSALEHIFKEPSEVEFTRPLAKDLYGNPII